MRNKGFTLIELVVVIVILGILAVVAAPKFMGLQRDARIADLKGLEGGLKAANEMVYAKAAMKGLEHSQQADWRSVKKNQIVINGKDVTLHFGHIKATESNIKSILDINDGDWNIQGYSGLFDPIYMTPKTAPAFHANNKSYRPDASGDNIKASNCYLSYVFPKPKPAWEIPQYKLVTSGC
ncbi:prepilin-type N-terminal cleavage/methylation domain-containing protein [Photobacterium carnosum]|uniref:type II secretion system protein n=1 Tax=Photobacterium carnosum TaxID=2023717 RepID=UPI0022B7A931|nr:prepilin-type N-terminal cleavage/methylation domain-containing protein [Photobacterium carnosum]MCD9539789.1 prepilin-type N-terminal cleavage/methylation domain-containing protein [Photobacterium carnosum]